MREETKKWMQWIVHGQVEMAWLLLFRHIAGFMRSGYEPVAEGNAAMALLKSRWIR